MSNHDPYGVKISEATMSCNQRTVQITTNDTLDSYAKITVKCDVKCSLAQQFAYKRLMEKKGSEKYTLLDDYWARARRISATYARFCLEEEDGCDKQLQGRYYWMGLGAFASKTVACMFDAWQVKYVTTGLHFTGMDNVYEGLAKGNFWLFQDIGSWHALYNMSVTKGEGYAGFVQCRDIKSADVLCDIPKNIVKNKLPWAGESLPLIGNLSKSAGRPQSSVLEDGMELVHTVETMILLKEKKKDIRLVQFEHLIAIAKHEQGNILQPLIYVDGSWMPTDFQDWLFAMRWLPAMPIVKLTLTSECDESQEKVEKLQRERNEKALKEYHETITREEALIRLEVQKLSGLGTLTEKQLNQEVLSRMKSEGVYAKVPMPEVAKAKIEDILSVPEDGDKIVLENYKIRMKWIQSAAQKYHDLWGSNPNYVKSELATMASWVEQEDRFDKTITKKY